MDETEIIDRLSKVEERSKSNGHRLDKLEPVVDEIHTISTAIVKLTGEMQYMNNTIDSVKEKVDVMEKAPGKSWSDAKRTLFNAILGSIGTAMGAAIIWALTQM